MPEKSRLRSRIAALSLVVTLMVSACGVPMDLAEPTPVASPQLDVGETPLPALSPTATLVPASPTLLPPTATRAPAQPTAVAPPAGATAEAAASPLLTPVASADGCENGAGAERLRPPTAVRPARAFGVLPLVPDPALDAAVHATLGDAGGSYAVVVKDLATGRGTMVNAHRVYYAASVFKMLVMYEAFSQVEQGMLSLDDEVQITPYYDSFGLGQRMTELCEQLPVQQALAAMMAISDNAAAVLLQDVVGAGNINASMRALGLTETRLLPEDLPLTAADVAILLEGIGRGVAINEASSRAMFQLMAGERFDNGIKAGVPAGTVVAHKTGNWSNATHDAAIVYSPKATYVLVVLSDRNHEVAVTRAVSQAVYSFFNP